MMDHNITRRRLLLGLAAASTAAAGGASATPAAPAESAELLAMPARVTAAVEVALRAEADRKAVYDEWDARMPEPPAELIRGAAGWYGSAIWQHIDGRDRGMLPRGGWARTRVSDATSIGHWQDEIRRFMGRSQRLATGKTWKGKTRDGWEAELVRLEGLKPLADAWHAETARVVEASGYDAAKRSARDATDRAVGLADRALGMHAAGMAGVVIKCQVVEAVSRLGLLAEIAGINSLNGAEGKSWQSLIAADVLRIAEAAA